MDIDKLIERLRNESLYKDKATLEIMDLCMEAAQALERLNNFYNSQSAKLLEENTQLRAERDAALADLNGLCWCCIHGTKWGKAPDWSSLTFCEHLGGSIAAAGSAKRKCIHVQCAVEALEELEKSTALTAAPAWTRRRTNDDFTRHLPDMPVTYALQRIFAQQLPALQKQAARNIGYL